MNMAQRTVRSPGPPEALQAAAPAGRVRVRALRMERLLAGVGWRSPVGLLKMDCEGCEWDTLLQPARTWDADHVVGEVHFGCREASCWPMASSQLRARVDPLRRRLTPAWATSWVQLVFGQLHVGGVHVGRRAGRPAARMPGLPAAVG
ncbi:unnamed protein product [Prorocentrum cordatum]|uniref:Methyltransferase FkbM domain-containing protein n=1 Tax=Prorocentrum cordatum TaxID=2364126 RepID=A0ABN9SMR2_9DINO|nr:unnamed protein product [Polarella glacialis]